MKISDFALQLVRDLKNARVERRKLNPEASQIDAERLIFLNGYISGLRQQLEHLL